jgi:class 3 adenylate cyclase
MVARNDSVDGIGPSTMLAYLVPEPELTELNRKLIDETSDARRISSWPIDRTFVYLDVSDFSREPPGRQALIINSIAGLVNNLQFWDRRCATHVQKAFEAMICIGDGYIFVFREPVDGVYFGAWLAQLIEEFVARKWLPVPFHFRMGVHTGRVYSFWDPGWRNWNYIGDGINGGNRVLAAVGKKTDDVVFISGDVRKELIGTGKHRFPFGEIRNCLHNRGRKADKHGNPWRVYELNHSQLCATEMASILSVEGSP